MPVYERERSKSNWGWWVGGCCGGGCLLYVIVSAGFFFAIRPVMKTMSTPPSSSTNPRVLRHIKSEECLITLPDGSGDVVFDETQLPDTGGVRSVVLETKRHNGVQCPMIYNHDGHPKIDVYWYPEKNGKGPFMRFAEGNKESLVDLQRGVGRSMYTIEQRKFAGDITDNSSSGMDYLKQGDKLVVNINDKPAEDVTNTFGKDTGTYLGAILYSSGKMTFTPAGKTNP